MKTIVVQPFNNAQTAVLENEAGRKTPGVEMSDGRYVVRFANTAQEVDAALRLRFEVFNIELCEGLESSHITGLDEDKYDKICHHLIVLERETGVVVGTYRLQTLEMAKSTDGFYCANEFKLEDLPPRVLYESLEIGRACIAREHRNSRVLFLLWKGLSAAASLTHKRYLFGCCSLTSQNAAEGWEAAKLIERGDALHPEFFIAPREDYICETESNYAENDDAKEHLPKLFLTYLRFGAKVCSPPAIDLEFKTIDFFVMFDFETIEEKYRQMFLS